MTTANHCMVDLETISTNPNAAIISIGACAFDIEGEGIKSEFYTVVNAESCVEAGLSVDQGTLDWWAKQGDAAKRVLDEAAASTTPSLREALIGFSKWFRENNLKYVWGNGAAFDNVILFQAYKAADLGAPWKCWDDRCYRTIKGLAPNIEIDRQGTHHNALDDAISQALHLQKILG